MRPARFLVAPRYVVGPPMFAARPAGVSTAFRCVVVADVRSIVRSLCYATGAPLVRPQRLFSELPRAVRGVSIGVAVGLPGLSRPGGTPGTPISRLA